MKLETFVKYAHFVGVVREVEKPKDLGYCSAEFYKFRLYHPLFWLVFLVAFVYNAFHLVIEMAESAKDKIEIHVK